MQIKKFSAAMLAATVAAGALTSCSDDDNNFTPNPDLPTTSAGAFVINQGNYFNNIEGEFNFISYETQTVENNIFVKANNRSLGNTPQCGLVYGSKIYLGVCFSQTVEVLDKKDYRSIKQLQLSDPAQGTQPRSMVAQGGYVYIAMYDGYLARLDTTTLAIDKSIKIGPNPENIAIFNGKIYTPDSDGMNYMTAYGETASVVDMASFTLEKTIKVNTNPSAFLVAAGKLYLYSPGNYGMFADQPYIPGAVYELEINGNETTSKQVGLATMPPAVKDGVIYMVNAPYGQETSYSKYDANTNTLTALEAPEVDYPNSIGVDPVTGYIFINSYNMDGAYPGYDLPGYTVQYDPSMKFVKKYNTGVGPAAIFFNTL